VVADLEVAYDHRLSSCSPPYLLHGVLLMAGTSLRHLPLLPADCCIEESHYSSPAEVDMVVVVKHVEE